MTGGMDPPIKSEDDNRGEATPPLNLTLDTGYLILFLKKTLALYLGIRYFLKVSFLHLYQSINSLRGTYG